jgi:hypothetical protein
MTLKRLSQITLWGHDDVRQLTDFGSDAAVE